ncbi:MAG: ankyrin repeat domain-containing protein [Chitinispirillales bacterium]|jgi:ankyrin repeat protein|nr:ankyrin repeat domain-containing protein [Chitinispirillales bacterium]
MNSSDIYFYLARTGDVESLKRYIETKQVDISIKDWRSETLLHAAAESGQIAIAELLISCGADVNAKSDNFLITPLHRAASEGHTALAEFLVSSGAEINVTERYGFTPLREAGFKGHVETVKFLVSKGGKTVSS